MPNAPEKIGEQAPTPWNVSGKFAGDVYIDDANGRMVGSAEELEWAETIVRAVNSHADLLAAATNLLAILKRLEWSGVADVTIGHVPSCPCCYAWNPKTKIPEDRREALSERLGHYQNCDLNAAISAATAALSKAGVP